MINLRLLILPILGALLSACTTSPKSALQFDVVVTQNPCPMNAKCYPTLQAALDSASKNRKHANAWYNILIKPGIYNEKIVIDQPLIHLVGQDLTTTQIQIDLAAQNAGQYHRNNWGTAGSATLTINADNIIIENLRIENTFDYLANDRKLKNNTSRVQHSQAVAVLLDSKSDRVAFKNVRLDSYQDTLFAHGGRAYFLNSTITGNVDFIFGDGQVLFESSIIISRLRGRDFKPGAIQGHITAPSTQLGSEYGFVFYQCELLREKGVPNASHTLGRPWHPTTTFDDGRYADPNAVGYTAYIDSYMDAHIVAKGWGSMKGTAPDGTKTRVFTPAESRFYEQGSTGPGKPQGMSTKMRKRLNATLSIGEIKHTLLNGWVPIF